MIEFDELDPTLERAAACETAHAPDLAGPGWANVTRCGKPRGEKPIRATLDEEDVCPDCLTAWLEERELHAIARAVFRLVVDAPGRTKAELVAALPHVEDRIDAALQLLHGIPLRKIERRTGRRLHPATGAVRESPSLDPWLIRLRVRGEFKELVLAYMTHTATAQRRRPWRELELGLRLDTPIRAIEDAAADLRERGLIEPCATVDNAFRITMQGVTHANRQRLALPSAEERAKLLDLLDAVPPFDPAAVLWDAASFDLRKHELGSTMATIAEAAELWGPGIRAHREQRPLDRLGAVPPDAWHREAHDPGAPRSALDRFADCEWKCGRCGLALRAELAWLERIEDGHELDEHEEEARELLRASNDLERRRAAEFIVGREAPSAVKALQDLAKHCGEWRSPRDIFGTATPNDHRQMGRHLLAKGLAEETGKGLHRRLRLTRQGYTRVAEAIQSARGK